MQQNNYNKFGSQQNGGFQRHGNYFNNNSSYNNNRGNRNYNNNQNFKYSAQNLGENLIDIDWSQEQLTPFVKNFYTDYKQNYSPEEIDEFRQENSISLRKCSQKDKLDPFIQWTDGNFPDYIMKTVEKCGYQTPTPIQSQAFPIIMSGKDFIGIAKTGSGKTASFLLPGLIHVNAQSVVKQGDGPILLVLAPTRELALQIQEESQKFGSASNLKSACVYGGVDRFTQQKQLQDGLDMVIATPGRLIDFLEQGVTNLRRVTYLVLDEADRMLDMGFEQQIRKIVGQIRPDRQTLMFSATWPKEIQNLARDFCKEDPVHIQIGDTENTVNQDIEQRLEIVDFNQKTQRIIEQLDEMSEDDKVMIFCATKSGCDALQSALKEERFPCLSIHGDKSQNNRDKVIQLFKSGSKFRILVATDVASRGLDVSDITYVINYDLPKNIEDYIHRIGRTGRAGKRGVSVAYINEGEDLRVVQQIAQQFKQLGRELPEDIQQYLEKNGRFNNSNSGRGRGGYNNNNNRGGFGRGRGRGGYNNNNNNSNYNRNRQFDNNDSAPFQKGRNFMNNDQKDSQPFQRQYNNNGNNNYRNNNNNNYNNNGQQSSGYVKMGFKNSRKQDDN